MKVVWTQGIDPALEKEIRGDFKSSLLIRNRLKVILKDLIETDRRQAIRKDGYDSPSWAFRMADNAGFERALNSVIEIISE